MSRGKGGGSKGRSSSKSKSKSKKKTTRQDGGRDNQPMTPIRPPPIRKADKFDPHIKEGIEVDKPVDYNGLDWFTLAMHDFADGYDEELFDILIAAESNKLFKMINSDSFLDIFDEIGLRYLQNMEVFHTGIKQLRLTPYRQMSTLDVGYCRLSKHGEWTDVTVGCNAPGDFIYLVEGGMGGCTGHGFIYRVSKKYGRYAKVPAGNY